LAQELPPHRTFDHQIQIKEEKEVPFGPIYHLSEKELGALREYLDYMLEKGKITESNANMGAPMIFIPKPNRKLQQCVDYRGLNAITIKDLYSSPLMDELRDRVVGC
jgi:site-specific recombinase XerC